MRPFQPADHLHSRTFLSLLVAQFLAAFNDQAIHASAMFFAINTGTMTEARAITLMPILFYAPWAIFCTLAGYFADRYSKRGSLILWKVAEVGITLLALGGFWLGRAGHPTLGSYVVLGTVFLMGMHSAFFVPAKYGAMPEILTPRMLSKGNGVLESLSFLAVILGTVSGGVLTTVFRGEEYVLGLILVGLAVVGAAASFFLEAIPAANPNRPFPPYVYKPLVKNIGVLLSSKPLVFAVVGIAFFTFLVSYMRAVVYMHGQSQLPPWSEADTSYIVGMVALGIGIGSPLVGWLAGGKVEVGLVAIGAVGMVLATSVAAVALTTVPVLVACIILIGFFTGFYLVPLFSLLQHRAPKTSKGDMIATSNFINITGAILASLVFWGIDATAVRTGFTPPLPEKDEVIYGFLGEPPAYDDDAHVEKIVVDGIDYHADHQGPNYVIIRLGKGVGEGEDVAIRSYGVAKVTYLDVQLQSTPAEPIYNKERLPALLFMSAGGMTLVTLMLLWYLLPDLFQRTRIWFQARFRKHLEVANMLRLPPKGPVVVVTDAADAAGREMVLSAGDREMLFLADGEPGALLDAWRQALAKQRVVVVPVGQPFLADLLHASHVPVLPVHYAERATAARTDVVVIAGALLQGGTTPAAVQAELTAARLQVEHHVATGEPLEREASDWH